MASVNLKTNIGAVSARLRRKLSSLNDSERLLRPVCLDVIDMLTQRIHIDGQASDGQAIGTYDEGYLAMRESKYGRLEGSKVVISLTSQLENDYGVAATDKGYGVGFSNVLNFNKAGWVEEHFGKKIFSLTSSEKVQVNSRLAEIVEEILRDE